MTKDQHIQEALRLISEVDETRKRCEGMGFEADPRELDRLVAMAHVHALLAIATEPEMRVSVRSGKAVF